MTICCCWVTCALEEKIRFSFPVLCIMCPCSCVYPPPPPPPMETPATRKPQASGQHIPSCTLLRTTSTYVRAPTLLRLPVSPESRPSPYLLHLSCAAPIVLEQGGPDLPLSLFQISWRRRRLPSRWPSPPAAGHAPMSRVCKKTNTRKKNAINLSCEIEIFVENAYTFASIACVVIVHRMNH